MSNLSKLLARGNALARQGNIVDARAEFEKAARDHGRSAEPWISLSAVLGMQGNYTESMRCARKAVELSPNSLQGWVNLGNAAQSNGNVGQAAEAFQRALMLPGCPQDVLLQLGMSLVLLGQWREAESYLNKYLTHHPYHRDATLALSKALAALGDLESAARMIEDYCGRNNTDIEALSRLGAVYFDMGRTAEAWRLCHQAVAQAPASYEALFFNASLLAFEGKYLEARDIYEQLHRSQPRNLQVLDQLARICVLADDAEASIAYARAALNLNRRSVPNLKTLSMLLLNADVAEARKLMEEAIAIAPDDLSLLVLKGRILEVEGDKQGAWDCVHLAGERGYFDTGSALVAAGVAPALEQTQTAIDLVERYVVQPGLTLANQRILRFALAKLCDKAKQYDRAFEHALIANKARKVEYDADDYAAKISRLKSVYSASAMSSLPRATINSELPVFIVGMPRSGTSLLEQILSCHTKIHARGETSDVGNVAEAIPYYPDGVRNLTSQRLDAMATAYIGRLVKMAPTATRVTDKLPGNYLYLGFISQLFPGAKVIHCLRDPRDVCLSNYFTDFNIGHYYSSDLGSLARHYRTYRDLMEHWKAVLPILILEVRYEDLVDNPREWTEKILDFCGLDWEEACLDFHKSRRRVATASYDQVRNPLYKSSIARWKNYERHLEPVSRILGLHGDSYT